MADVKKLLGQRIKELRKNKGYSQAELGELVQLEEVSISNIETGKYYPSADTIDKLSMALEAPISSLFTFEHLKTPPQEVMAEEVHKAMLENEVLAHQLYMTYKNLNY